MTSSKSVRLLSVVLTLGAVVAAATAGPGLLQQAQAVVDVQPQLLLVDDRVKGIFAIGEGVTVSMFDSGLQVRRAGEVIFETVRRGSPLSAAAARVEGAGEARAQRVEATADSLHVTSIEVGPSRAIYRGTLLGGAEPLASRIAVALTVARVGRGVDITAQAPGAPMLVLHTERPQRPIGVPPALPLRTLGARAWWVAPQADKTGRFVRLMTSAVRGNRTITWLRTSGEALVDLRHQGRGEIHVFDQTLRLRVQ